ncbi:hypothetical protein B0H15DRAFT_813376 [Mycena belliarum]|uniref:SAGA-associated factor 11 n=1 Tax=Mycena belliarum TaxID=1033014 RepID=A0AAD6UFY8_9AGAR|nr:hypothetical protein B0H15DRAFT_813376 [Mycena belliae]
MVKSQKEETLSALATRIFSAMLEDIVMDITLQSHHETARSRSICAVCKTRCSSVHTPSNSQGGSQQPLPSRPSTPAASGSAGTGTSTPTSAKADGNLYLECVNCSRQVASSRYAPHLSSCMGLATTRRGAARGNTVKTSKPPSEAGGRSTSPEAVLTDDGSNLKGKSKSKTKLTDEAEFNLKRKRPESPQLTSNKKQKKQSAPGSPVARIKAGADAHSVSTNPTHHSPSKVPSKLRDSSTVLLIEPTSTPSSRFSSPALDSPESSYNSNRSPSLTDRGNGSPTKSVRGRLPNILPPKRSPPRPVVDDYLLDEGGNETGSSTDTDSS